MCFCCCCCFLMIRSLNLQSPRTHQRDLILQRACYHSLPRAVGIVARIRDHGSVSYYRQAFASPLPAFARSFDFHGEVRGSLKPTLSCLSEDRKPSASLSPTGMNGPSYPVTGWNYCPITCTTLRGPRRREEQSSGSPDCLVAY